MVIIIIIINFRQRIQHNEKQLNAMLRVNVCVLRLLNKIEVCALRCI